MSDLYDLTDNIEDQNTFPEDQPQEKQRPSNPEGDVAPETVDFFQQHPHIDEWNEPDGLLSLYDPTNPDRQYFDIVETEIISLTSPPIKYYKLNVQNSRIDPLYGESLRRDAYDMPVTIFGSYENPSIEQELQSYGLTNLEELEIWFNYNHILHTLGDKLHIGDILQTYDAKLWEVMTSILIDESLWRAQHNKIVVKRLNTEGIWLPDQPDITISPNEESRIE